MAVSNITPKLQSNYKGDLRKDDAANSLKKPKSDLELALERLYPEIDFIRNPIQLVKHAIQDKNRNPIYQEYLYTRLMLLFVEYPRFFSKLIDYKAEFKDQFKAQNLVFFRTLAHNLSQDLAALNKIEGLKNNKRVRILENIFNGLMIIIKYLEEDALPLSLFPNNAENNANTRMVLSRPDLQMPVTPLYSLNPQIEAEDTAPSTLPAPMSVWLASQTTGARGAWNPGLLVAASAQSGPVALPRGYSPSGYRYGSGPQNGDDRSFTSARPELTGFPASGFSSGYTSSVNPDPQVFAEPVAVPETASHSSTFQHGDRALYHMYARTGSRRPVVSGDSTSRLGSRRGISFDQAPPVAHDFPHGYRAFSSSLSVISEEGSRSSVLSSAGGGSRVPLHQQRQTHRPVFSSPPLDPLPHVTATESSRVDPPVHVVHSAASSSSFVDRRAGEETPSASHGDAPIVHRPPTSTASTGIGPMFSGAQAQRGVTSVSSSASSHRRHHHPSLDGSDDPFRATVQNVSPLGAVPSVSTTEIGIGTDPIRVRSLSFSEIPPHQPRGKAVQETQTELGSPPSSPSRVSPQKHYVRQGRGSSPPVQCFRADIQPPTREVDTHLTYGAAPPDSSGASQLHRHLRRGEGLLEVADKAVQTDLKPSEIIKGTINDSAQKIQRAWRLHREDMKRLMMVYYKVKPYLPEGTGASSEDFMRIGSNFVQAEISAPDSRTGRRRLAVPAALKGQVYPDLFRLKKLAEKGRLKHLEKVYPEDEYKQWFWGEKAK